MVEEIEQVEGLNTTPLGMKMAVLNVNKELLR